MRTLPDRCPAGLPLSYHTVHMVGPGGRPIREGDSEAILRAEHANDGSVCRHFEIGRAHRTDNIPAKDLGNYATLDSQDGEGWS